MLPRKVGVLMRFRSLSVFLHIRNPQNARVCIKLPSRIVLRRPVRPVCSSEKTTENVKSLKLACEYHFIHVRVRGRSRWTKCKHFWHIPMNWRHYEMCKILYLSVELFQVCRSSNFWEFQWNDEWPLQHWLAKTRCRARIRAIFDEQFVDATQFSFFDLSGNKADCIQILIKPLGS